MSTEDIASLTTSRIRRYPDSDILLASPECTNHSLAKGSRRRKPQRSSLFDDGPAGDDEQERSRATMWDVVRFAEQKRLKGRPYKAIVVENVVDAYKWGYDDDGGLFQAWLQAMLALGYRHEIVWLNSMFCPPTPQSRDRMSPYSDRPALQRGAGATRVAGDGALWPRGRSRVRPVEASRGHEGRNDDGRRRRRLRRLRDHGGAG